MPYNVIIWHKICVSIETWLLSFVLLNSFSLETVGMRNLNVSVRKETNRSKQDGNGNKHGGCILILSTAPKRFTNIYPFFSCEF